MLTTVYYQNVMCIAFVSSQVAEAKRCFVLCPVSRLVGRAILVVMLALRQYCFDFGHDAHLALLSFNIGYRRDDRLAHSLSRWVSGG